MLVNFITYSSGVGRCYGNNSDTPSNQLSHLISISNSRYSIPVVRIWVVWCVFPVESQVTLGITQQVLDPFARSGPRGKSKVAAKRPPWECWHGCTWHPRYSLRAMLEYCSASYDLRLLLCDDSSDDFKDYPRRGKFTHATRLKDSMSKAVSPCNSPDMTFISFPEPCGTNLAQESIHVYHAWQLHVLLGCCGIHC